MAEAVSRALLPTANVRSNSRPSLSAFERHSLFEACAREARRLGGDDRTADYFFKRAQTSNVWLSAQGAVTIADMDISDWCEAIVWSAPGTNKSGAHGLDATGRKQPRSGAKSRRG